MRPAAKSPRLGASFVVLSASLPEAMTRSHHAVDSALAAGQMVARRIGGAVIVHWAVKEARRINEELDNARRVKVRINDRENRPTLRRDPRTGEYRPY